MNFCSGGIGMFNSNISSQNSEVLMSSHLFSKVFPANDTDTGVAESHNVKLDCQKRLQEGRSKRAHNNRQAAQ